GIVVVASAGNSGANQYIAGSPATAEGAISVAANDPTPSFPGASITFSGGTIPAIDANGHPLSGTTSYTIKVLTGANVLGCSVAAFGGPLPPNTIALVNRRTCAPVAKAVYWQQAGTAPAVTVTKPP